MGSVRVRRETGTLFLDFRWNGNRTREQTSLPDTPSNRKRLRAALLRIELAISEGTYAGGLVDASPTQLEVSRKPHSTPSASAATEVPTFGEFAEQWFEQTKIQWRRSYRITQRGALDKYLIPYFETRPINQIEKHELLAFRSALAASKGRASDLLSARRINAVMKPLRQLLAEAADRYNFSSPFRGIKPLRAKRADVMPFTLDQVQQLVSEVRPDYRAYLTVRFFTGMRTGEIHGLKWKYVDFDRAQILVRESFVLGEEDDLKTDGSQRDIHMSKVVQEALKIQLYATGGGEYVFANRLGKPLDNKNFVNRIWSPLLKKVGLALRRPYHMRHTTATLWLAAGEAPEWIARQLGHTTTEMLFRVYSRYVPNLTRQDGSAFDRLLGSTFKTDA